MKKLRLNEGKSKIMRSSRYGNACDTKCKPLEEVDCLKYLGRKWQLMGDVKGMWCTE